MLTVKRSDFVRKEMNDEDPDLSYLGKYTDKPKDDYYIDRMAGQLIGTEYEVLADGLSTMERNEFRFFESCNHSNPGNPTNWFPHVTKPQLNAAFKKANFNKHGISPNLDKHPKEFWLDIFYFCEDYERMEDFNRGGWSCVGIRAEVTLQIPSNGYVTADGKSHKSWITHTIHSPGIWGIESDSDDAYKDGVFRDESEILAGMLKEIGVRVRK